MEALRSDRFDGDRRAGQIRMDENRRAHLGCCAGHSYFCPCSPKGNKKVGRIHMYKILIVEDDLVIAREISNRFRTGDMRQK